MNIGDYGSYILILGRIIDTILSIQKKIRESNLDLIQIACHVSKNDVNAAKKFFYEERKIWNLIHDSKLEAIIEDEFRKMKLT